MDQEDPPEELSEESDATIDAEVVWVEGAGSRVDSQVVRRPLSHPIFRAATIGWLELFAVALIVFLCDLTIYRGKGFAGYAVLFCGIPPLFWLGSGKRWLTMPAVVVAGMIIALSIRLVWSGGVVQVMLGFGLIVSFAISLSGLTPYLTSLLKFTGESVPVGIMRIYTSLAKSRAGRALDLNLPYRNVLIPLAVASGFTLIFLFANPDLRTTVFEFTQNAYSQFLDIIANLRPFEFVFWVIVAIVSLGLIRPIKNLKSVGTDSTDASAKDVHANHAPAPSPNYIAFRNTLFSVIGLFSVYLVFEFLSFWFREFPEGFYYAGYAHQGAAWLTVALALSTATLSFIFQGLTLNDLRVKGLKQLAWIWSAQNFLLALAVYNRLYMYMQFNGMTYMRTIALFGISTVVVGFILVLWKIIRGHSFFWLLQRQLWTLSFAVFLFVLTPVDVLVVKYNVSKIMNGELAPAVQITHQHISTEGVPHLLPLVECEDEIIREGVIAMLAERKEIEARRQENAQDKGWTAYQMSTNSVVWQLKDFPLEDSEQDEQERRDTIERFMDYTFQWY